jgi:hypothetical protein
MEIYYFYMQMNNRISLLLIVMLGFMPFIPACTGDETYPVTPAITFKSLQKLPSTGTLDSLELIFSFTDGDGDLGTPAIDVTTRDIFVKLFERKNGVFEEAILAAPLEYRIPYLNPRGNNKSLKGDIKISIDYNILQPNDTIYYTLYITDRAGHKSNSIQTTTIITNIQ